MGIDERPDDTLDVSESLDSDEVRNSDGDDVVDAPDTWRDADIDETLDERLAEEEPDIPENPYGRHDDGLVHDAEIVNGVIVEDLGRHRGQIDGDAAGGGPAR
ncbi:hypothetical protein [Prescottella subtropica]|uniref:hypothetical protein n=1 Tax=Prescottella subtropica TaxID=2545757 RepID=UPI0010F8C3ED|nr:hypothetical protein [Prescottella subtropica]